MFLVEGYFDESGDLDEAPGVFCLSGYFLTPDSAKRMDEEWLAVLNKYQLAFFHMVDCAHGVEGFQHLTKDDRVQCVTELIELIKKYTLEGFSIITSSDSYKTHLNAPDAYSDCASGCVRAVQSYFKMNRVDGPVAYFFEQGHKNRHTAYSYVGPILKRDIDSLTFASKQKVRLLQAADLLAWQSTKYAKDYFYARMLGHEPKRPPRKDFMNLMQHDHIFAYMGANGEKDSMGVELWPMTKRSQLSVDLSVKDDLALSHWYESGDPVPIIPVERTVAWRPGGSRFTYIGFKGLVKDQNFAIGFDEPRLFEAVAVFLDATGNYENSQNVPFFSAERVGLEESDGIKVLRIKLKNAASIGIHLSDENYAELKAQLEK